MGKNVVKKGICEQVGRHIISVIETDYRAKDSFDKLKELSKRLDKESKDYSIKMGYAGFVSASLLFLYNPVERIQMYISSIEDSINKNEALSKKDIDSMFDKFFIRKV
jgi:hypothetical protein